MPKRMRGKLARELGVSLEFKVMVSDAEMVELLSSAAAMIYAPRLEPFGMAPLEANLCGLPVVAASNLRRDFSVWLI